MNGGLLRFALGLPVLGYVFLRVILFNGDWNPVILVTIGVVSLPILSLANARPARLLYLPLAIVALVTALGVGFLHVPVLGWPTDVGTGFLIASPVALAGWLGGSRATIPSGIIAVPVCAIVGSFNLAVIGTLPHAYFTPAIPGGWGYAMARVVAGQWSALNGFGGSAGTLAPLASLYDLFFDAFVLLALLGVLVSLLISEERAVRLPMLSYGSKFAQTSLPMQSGRSAMEGEVPPTFEIPSSARLLSGLVSLVVTLVAILILDAAFALSFPYTFLGLAIAIAFVVLGFGRAAFPPSARRSSRPVEEGEEIESADFVPAAVDQA